MNRKQNIYIVSGVIVTIMGIILLIIREDIALGFFDKRSSITISLFASFLLLYGIGFLLYTYLQFSRRIESVGFLDGEIELSSDVKTFETSLEELKLELLKLKGNEQSNGVNREEINELIKKQIYQNLDSKNFLSILEERFRKQSSEENKILRIAKDFENINQRINFEISRLTKSANINLVFGSITTLIAIGFLAYEVLYKEINFKELIPLLSHYIPRVAIVIFVEIFAFFFLKIYKANLADIKYFHNEKTNVDLKLVAIKAAIETRNETIMQTVIQELSKTERNFILKQGESTIELEKSKIDVSSDKNVIDALRDLLKTK